MSDPQLVLGWAVDIEDGGRYVARSPSFAVDGLMVVASDRDELEIRVQVVEHMVARAAGLTTHPAPRKWLAGVEFARAHAAPAPSIEAARALGFDGGEFCPECGSPNTKRQGLCLYCANCGANTGCG